MIAGAAAAAVAALLSGPATAQHPVQTKEGASIVVEGNVREVFRSQRQTQIDYVVQIDVERSEYGRAPADPKRVQAPAPGDQVYVHLFTPKDGFRGAGHSSIPAERGHVRALSVPPGSRGLGRGIPRLARRV